MFPRLKTQAAITREDHDKRFWRIVGDVIGGASLAGSVYALLFLAAVMETAP